MPGPRTANSGGGTHAGALAPSTGGAPRPGGGPAAAPRAGAPARAPAGGGPPPRGGGGAPCAYTLCESTTPSLFASRRIVMLLAPGELTNRSPLGAYVIMRGERRSAYGVTVKPFAAFGIMPSGRATARLGLGLAPPGAGSALARGWGTTVFCCATRTLVASTTAARPATVLAIDLMQSNSPAQMPRAMIPCESRIPNPESRVPPIFPPCVGDPCCSLRRCFQSGRYLVRAARPAARPTAWYRRPDRQSSR